MTNGATPSIPGWIIFLMLGLLVGVIVLAVMMFNLNSNMAVMDTNGRELTDWARTTAKWTTHVNEFHLRQMHLDSNLAPDHIPPPQDPPPDW